MEWRATLFLFVYGCADSSEAGSQTKVTTTSSAHDKNGCLAPGCVAELTRDGNFGDNSRWACRYNIDENNCKLRYKFEDPQELISVDLAFYKGDERKRAFRILTFDSDNERKTYQFTSGGETALLESFEIGRKNVAKVVIQLDKPDKKKWISIIEVISQSSDDPTG